MLSGLYDEEKAHGILGLRCGQLPSYGALIAYFPSLVFITAYILCIRQALIIASPNRGQRSSLAKILLTSFFFVQSYEMWIHMVNAVDNTVEYVLVDRQIRLGFLKHYCELSKLEIAKIGFCSLISVVPVLALLILAKQHQRFSIMWMDLRRRYQGELGSGRYYLSRPCEALEMPTSSGSDNGASSLRKTKSDLDVVSSSRSIHQAARQSKSY